MLSVRGLSKHYGTLRAVDGVDLDVPAGTVVGVMGVNGAGKSTLLDCVCGVQALTFGEVSLDGRSLVGKAAHQISRCGLGRTFQIPRNFRSLTTIENILVSTTAGKSARSTEAASRILAEVGLRGKEDSYANELSGGQQKLLELARIIIGAPRVILLDEPFAGMHPDLCRVFIDRIRDLVSEGVSIMLVSHDPDTLYKLSSSIVVMNQGRIIARGAPEEIRASPVVIDAYLGG